ncbi:MULTISPECIES: hypothetical protein [Legionella]|uniref:hypothetical protein n=1 Tax=Legionella TaxID=445 RepID=UPI000F8D6691|nr:MULTISPECIES: hypothetical protein [Legionella]MCP0914845.1 hypothetical protein [Legionella sp. 27cVA30]RUR02910.1 hypothetical protein ELY11_00710 [Legionella septentrionalis]RUR11509.1 hypothetical protein ELY14_01820 [Legionella septentrionalis]RUR16774.1 hypothetical protein ELY10_02535 [Legionella septentrionalis]
MEKQFLSPLELLNIATQHAYCAEYLLKSNGEIPIDEQLSVDALLPVISLIHIAFELTLKAYLMHDHRNGKQFKNLEELLELNQHLGLSKQEKQLLTLLARQQAFRKGSDYQLWENRQQLHVFCEQLMSLYVRLQELMPLELQSDYNS